MGLPLFRSMQPGFKSFTSTSSLDFYVCWFLFMICYHYICFKRKQTLETYRNTYRKNTGNIPEKNTFGSKPPFRQIYSVSSVSSLSSYIKFSFVASRFSRLLMRPLCLLSRFASRVQSKSILHHMFECWSPKAPQKFEKSHGCVPCTAAFSKRRKIGAL